MLEGFSNVFYDSIHLPQGQLRSNGLSLHGVCRVTSGLEGASCRIWAAIECDILVDKQEPRDSRLMSGRTKLRITHSPKCRTAADVTNHVAAWREQDFFGG